MKPAPAEPRGAAGQGRRAPLLLLFVLLLIPGCFTAGKDLPREAAPGIKPEAPDPAAGTGMETGPETEAASPRKERLRALLIPGEVRPGEPFVAAFVAPGGAAGDYRAALYNRRGERIAGAAFFSPDRERPEALVAALAVPSTAAPGEAQVRLERGGITLETLILGIAGREFLTEEIILDQRNTDIRVAPDPQKTLESEQLSAIIHATGTEVYAAGVFVPPVSSTRRTSFYGDRRIFRYATGGSDTAIHAGIDYGVPTGTEVRACAAGKVALARHRISTGNSVVLEHLPGVYSLYYHLDTIEAGQGDIVRAGDLLGKSGSTGLATGPHLHWEIRVSGENADPDSFLARAILDKDAIFATLER
jgi:murein DD-endopeptidase MepM/ murein hydrolase activator NlpD